MFWRAEICKSSCLTYISEFKESLHDEAQAACVCRTSTLESKLHGANMIAILEGNIKFLSLYCVQWVCRGSCDIVIVDNSYPTKQVHCNLSICTTESLDLSTAWRRRVQEVVSRRCLDITCSLYFHIRRESFFESLQASNTTHLLDLSLVSIH
jgi:hypothetical protein